MSDHAIKEPQWDMFIIEVEDRVCLLAFSGVGQAFVERHRDLGEDFGNGLLLKGDEVEFAFDALDTLGLIARPL